MRRIGYPPAVSELSRPQLSAMVDEASVDCHGEDEQVSGLYTMIVDNLPVPFQTQVLGVDVTVEDIDLTGRAARLAPCPGPGSGVRLWCPTGKPPTAPGYGAASVRTCRVRFDPCGDSPGASTMRTLARDVAHHVAFRSLICDRDHFPGYLSAYVFVCAIRVLTNVHRAVGPVARARWGIL